MNEQAGDSAVVPNTKNNVIAGVDITKANYQQVLFELLVKAMEVELATIPLYLYSWFSLVDSDEKLLRDNVEVPKRTECL